MQMEEQVKQNSSYEVQVLKVLKGNSENPHFELLVRKVAERKEHRVIKSIQDFHKLEQILYDDFSREIYFVPEETKPWEKQNQAERESFVQEAQFEIESKSNFLFGIPFIRDAKKVLEFYDIKKVQQRLGRQSINQIISSPARASVLHQPFSQEQRHSAVPNSQPRSYRKAEQQVSYSSPFDKPPTGLSPNVVGSKGAKLQKTEKF